MNTDVIIIGAGLSGLSCALHLQEHGISYLILERDSQVGGRVQTDEHSGFLLDRGFQVFLDSYPFASHLLDVSSLHLKPFQSGSLIWTGTSLKGFYNPLRHPFRGIRSLRNNFGTFSDMLNFTKLASSCLNYQLSSDHREDESTHEMFQRYEFSDRFRKRFLSPFFGGIYLEKDLLADASFAKFLIRMFGRGCATLPSEGMQAIPQQLLSRLKPECLRLEAEVKRVLPGRVVLAGEMLEARVIVLATDLWQTSALFPEKFEARHLEHRAETHCLYFEITGKPPVLDSVLILNGTGEGCWNNLCFPSQVSAHYAPKGKSLCSVTVLSPPLPSEEDLEQLIKQELKQVFGNSVDHWRFLRKYRIAHALPPYPLSDIQYQDKEFIFAGDYTRHPSIEGALLSGRDAAVQACEQLSSASSHSQL